MLISPCRRILLVLCGAATAAGVYVSLPRWPQQRVIAAPLSENASSAARTRETSHASRDVAERLPRLAEKLAQACREPRPAPDCPDTALLTILGTVDASDCVVLLARLADIASAAERDRWREALFARLAGIAPERAAELAAQIRNRDRRADFLQRVVDRWSEIDAPAAADWLRRLDGAPRDELLGPVLSRWADTDFPRALSWAKSLDDAALCERALAHLSDRWIATSPREALAFAAEHPSASLQLLATLASQSAGRDPLATAEWALNLTDSNIRIQALASVSATWAGARPQEAFAFAASLPSAEARDAALTAVISTWGLHDPAGAAAALELSSTGAANIHLVGQLLSSWVQTDPAAAAEWLLASPERHASDAALDVLSGSLAEHQPRVALAFAASIGDEAMRRLRVERIARTWLAADTQAALAGLRTARVPEELVAKLLPP